MNNQFNEYFWNSQLAMAAYADFGGSGSIEANLIASGFSQSQASVLLSRYQFVDQYTDSATGFSGTIFFDTVENKHVFALRGTGPDYGDILADIDLALNGVATEQIISMMNYYFRLISPAGTANVPQYTLTTIHAMEPPSEPHIVISSPVTGNQAPVPGRYLVLDEAANADGIGALSSSAGLTITGHSLGGHLATAFARLFPGVISEVLTYNSAGINAGLGSGLDRLSGLLSNITTPVDINPGASADGNTINVIAEPGWDAVPSVGELVGAESYLFIEQQPVGLFNHSIVHLADSLAVYNLMEAMDPNLHSDTASEILYNAANDAGSSLENIIDSLGRLFGLGAQAGNGDLYAAIQNIQNAAQNSDLTFVSLDSISAASLASSAQGGNLGTLYALINLNPYALGGPGAQALYQPFIENGMLDVGQYSEEYLQSRAQMLAHMIRLNSDDDSYTGAPGVADFYHDLATGTIISPFGGGQGAAVNIEQHIFGSSNSDAAQGGNAGDYLYGGAGSDTLIGGDGDDHIEGGADDDNLYGDLQDPENVLANGADTLQGGDGIDRLYGGRGVDHLYGDDGNDELHGGAGNDVLDGGEGDDTYVYTAGGGVDTINDSDGIGRIVYDGVILVGGTAPEPDEGESGNVYTSPDGEFIYTWEGSTLTINRVGGDPADAIVLENFNNRGEQRIHLDREGDPDVPTYTPPIQSMSPLVLDLNGDGVINSVALEDSTAYFDIDVDGVAEHVGWIAPGDGILVYDENGNGVIDNNSEAFGGDINGFDDLAITADSNGDGKIDSSDSLFSELRVWQDLNQDGISQSNELQSLSNYGITEISTAYERVSIPSNGNHIIANGSYKVGETTALIADIEFAYDDALTRPVEENIRNNELLAELDPEAFSLPWLRGFGNVPDLHVAYHQHPELQALAASMKSGGIESISQNFESFISQWSGLKALHQANNIQRENGLLTVEDKIWILETFVGVEVLKPMIEANNFGTIIPWGPEGGRRGIDLNSANSQFSDVASHYYRSFIAQAVLGDALRGAFYSINGDRFITHDAQELVNSLAAHVNSISSQDEALVFLDIFEGIKSDLNVDIPALVSRLEPTPYSEFITGVLNGDGTYQEAAFYRSLYVGNESRDYVVGTGGHDRLSGGDGNDLLDGRAGNDILTGDNGNDSLAGGSGNDYLIGGSGNDTYRFNSGDGQDIVQDFNGSSIIEFGAGITANDLVVTRYGDDLFISISGGDDQLHIRSWFGSTGNRVEQILFQDGTVWGVAELQAVVTIAPASEGNDYLVGTAGADTINGLGGNDIIEGDGGDDILAGGAGNDTLQGEAGNDVYLFNRGDGQDTITELSGNDAIQFGANIVPGDVVVTRDSNNLYLAINGTNDRLTLSYWFWSSAYQIEQVVFNDGTVWNASTLTTLAASPTEGSDYIIGTAGADTISSLGGNDQILGQAGNDALNGGAGDDHIYGQDGNDTIDGGDGNDDLGGGTGSDVLNGGLGNDSLYGNEGDDTYHFNQGGGQDVIYDSIGTDIVRLGVGVVPGDVTITRDLYSLYLNINGGNDRLAFSNWFSSSPSRIEQVIFDDGTVWSATQLEAAAVVASASEGNDQLVGTAGNDTVDGLAGNDQIYGRDGSDTLAGGAGHDTVYGEAGNDILSGGLGSDSLQGDAGDDVYRFNRGDGRDSIYETGGFDSIEFGVDIAPGDVVVTRDSNSFIFSLNGTTDQLIVQNWFQETGRQIESVTFNDGTVWTASQLAAMVSSTAGADFLVGTEGADTINGLGGDDKIYGRGGDDLISGDAGNDELTGEAGNDVYRFNRGDGQDTIWDSSGSDTVQFGVDIAPGDITIIRDQYHLYLGINGTSDRLKLSAWFSNPSYQIEQVVFDNGTVWDAATLATMIASATQGNDILYGTADAETINGLAGNDHIYGQAGNDVLHGGDDNDKLYGEDGNDILRGEEGVDVLDGGDGNDFIFGGADNDVLSGGAGNDTLSGDSGDDSLDGWTGDDIYRFNRGDGQDYIRDSGGAGDSLQLGADIGPDDVTVTRDHYHLYISINGTSDRITFQYWFYEPNYRVEQVVFADGTVWDSATLIAKAATATEGNDYLIGGAGNDNIAGLSGDDGIYGQEGDDVLSGGAGRDWLHGEAGNDTYVFNRGDGQDYIEDIAGSDAVQFGADIAPADVLVSRDLHNLILSISGSNDRLMITNWFSDPDRRVEQVVFAGGTIWDAASIISMVSSATDGNDVLVGADGNDTLAGLGGNDTLYGQDGDDDLSGGAGNDVIHGGQGNDTLRGGTGSDNFYDAAGNDTYIFNLGDSYDSIQDDAGTDTVQFGPDIAPADVLVTRNLENLYLSINGGGGQLALMNWFNIESRKIEQVVFADGTIWDTEDLAGMVSSATAGNDFLVGGNGADTLEGLAGNDTLYGRDGDDILNGGTGADTLYGESANDTYVFNRDDGQDTVIDSGGVDRVQFGPNIAPTDIIVTRSTHSLYLSIVGTNDRLTLSGWFNNPAYQIEQVVFADGTLWDAAELTEMVSSATEGDDVLVGNDGNNNLTGLGGNDSLYGRDGDDTLTGGTGIDNLYGESGNDTYVFNRGDGQDNVVDNSGIDTLQFGSGIVPSDIIVTRNFYDLILSVSGTNDQLRLSNWFSNQNYQIEEVAFADGTVWDAQDLETMVLQATEGNDVLFGDSGNDTLTGLGGNDQLYGLGGDDTLRGGTGNDSIEGGSGNDIYIFNRGDGQDDIEDNGGTDTLQFGPDITPDDVTVSRDPQHLYISINGSTDRLTLSHWFYDPIYRIEQVVFDNGAVWDAEDLTTMVSTATEGNNFLVGDSGDNVIDGLGGNDAMYGLAGNDNLNGGAGNDNVIGDEGDDTLSGNTGSDWLSGGGGNDNYLFNLGYGSDFINESGGTADSIQFGPGIAPTNVAVTRDAYNLYLSIYGTSDRLMLSNWFLGQDYKVEQVNFADGTVWTASDLENRIGVLTENADSYSGDNTSENIQGLGGNDVLRGWDGDDILNGGAGNDELFGGSGNDTLNGGEGNDRVEGDLGDDTYVFSVGDGQDTLFDKTGANTVELGTGIAPADVVVSRDVFNLYLNVGSGGDRLMFQQWFLGVPYGDLQVTFADGTVWDKSDVEAMVPTSTGTQYDDYIVGSDSGVSLTGLGGNDWLLGGSGSDTLDGGVGADQLLGHAGSDAYVFGYGYGEDSIFDAGESETDIDEIRLGPGIGTGDVTFTRDSGDSLLISLNGTADRLYVGNWFEESHSIEQIVFADGTVWGKPEVEDHLTVQPGTESDDEIYGTRNADTIDGLGGIDNIYGNDGNDIIDGGLGDDYIEGGSGNDILSGGAGDDELYGDAGSDRYDFGIGSGYDIIFDEDGEADSIHFGPGVAPEDIQIQRVDGYLELHIDGTDDRLVLDWYGSSQYLIEQFVFDDGTVWNGADINPPYEGTEDGDYLEGDGRNDVILGFGGSDTLVGGAGNDIINGGTGNDYLQGGIGNDSYVFNIGSGFDVIYDEGGEADAVHFGPGITPEDIEIRRVDEHQLEFSVSGTEDKFNFHKTSQLKIEQFIFTDGTVWNIDDINPPYEGTENSDFLATDEGNDTILGLGGDDYLSGGAGDDVLDGGEGDDSLVGGSGADVYLFRRGDGNDVINSDSISSLGSDILRFEDVLASEVSVTREDQSLAISVIGTQDRVVVDSWFNDWNDGYFRLGGVEFADGTVWDAQTLENVLIPAAGTEGDDNIYGGGADETLGGLAGYDQIYGGAGADTLIGGLDDDSLYGGSGNDTYVFNVGDGWDYIEERDPTPGNIDTLRFGEGISLNDVVVTRDEEELYIEIGGSDGLQINQWFEDEAYQVERFEFADGTIWDVADIESQIEVPLGTEDDEEIYGASGANLVFGAGGDDWLVGYLGDDVLIGGSGYDEYQGGKGEDVYAFNPGDITTGDMEYIEDHSGEFSDSSSIDSISLGGGLQPSDIYAYFEVGSEESGGQEWSWSVLYLQLGANGGTIQIDWMSLYSDGQGYEENSDNRIERLQFVGLNDHQIFDLIGLIEARYDDLVEAWEDETFIPLFTPETLTEFDITATAQLAGGDYAYNYALIGDPLVSPNIVAGETSGNDSLTGTAGSDVIRGMEGNDSIQAGAGNDLLDGGEGNDTLYGADGNDQQLGGAGGDNLMGGNGADFLDGGEGADYVYYSSSVSAVAVDLANGTASGGYAEGDMLHNIEHVWGSAWDDTITGNASANYLLGGSGNDVLTGNGGADGLYAGNGDDSLLGGDGNDTLYGEAGSDQLVGGVGNDGLLGGTGSDYYYFGTGDDQDSITEDSGGVIDTGATDVVGFTPDITIDELWFTREGDHLQIWVDGTDDHLKINNWYSNSAPGIEQFVTTEYLLLVGQVQQLVDAMAVFDPPNTGVMNVPQEARDDVAAVVAASWTYQGGPV